MLVRLNWANATILTAMSLASISLLVAFGGVSWTPVAERYMYAPSAFLMIGLVSIRIPVLWSPGPLTKRLGVVCFAIVLLSAAATTYQRTLVWSDNLALLKDTVDKSPGFSMAKNELAMLLYRQGNKIEALELIDKTEVPDSQAASLNKVMIFIETGELDKAREFLLDRLEDPATIKYRRDILNTLLHVSHLQLEQCYDAKCRTGFQEDVLGWMQRLLDQTGDPFYLYRIGQFQLSIGEHHAAQKSFQRAYAKLPETSEYKEHARRLAESLDGQ